MGVTNYAFNMFFVLKNEHFALNGMKTSKKNRVFKRGFFCFISLSRKTPSFRWGMKDFAA